MEPESITTNVLFSSGKITPTTIFIQNRPVAINKVIFHSLRREGQVEIMTFTLASDTAFYEVEFNKTTLKWQLKNIFLEG